MSLPTRPAWRSRTRRCLLLVSLLLLSGLAQIHINTAAATPATTTVVDTLQASETSTGTIVGSTRQGVSFSGTASGTDRGRMTATISYTPADPACNGTNTITGGTWSLTTATTTLSGTIGPGTVTFGPLCAIGTVSSPLAVTGGGSGTGDFAGVLNHLPVIFGRPATLAGVLHLRYNRGADLTSTNTCTPATPTTAIIVTCTVVAGNAGGASATVPTGSVLFRVVSTASGGAALMPTVVTPPANTTCSVSATPPATVTCTAATTFTIAPGGTATLVYQGQSATAGAVSSAATVNPDGTIAELSASNNTATSQVTVAAPPALSLPFSISSAQASIAATDPSGSQAGPFAQGGSCALSGARHYDSYLVGAITNFSLQVTPGTIPSVTIGVYKGGYNPADGCQNAVAVVQATGGSVSVSLTNTPPGALILIVSGTTPSDLGSYSLSVQ